jgi:hypothetical protein
MKGNCIVLSSSATVKKCFLRFLIAISDTIGFFKVKFFFLTLDSLLLNPTLGLVFGVEEKYKVRKL